MHEFIWAFVDSAVEAFRLRGPVYRIAGGNGAPAIGAGRSECFPGTSHIDCELAEWTDTDRLPFADGVAGTVLCAGSLEYVFRPQHAVEEMTRILAPGGALLISAPSERGESEQMPAYWRLTPRCMQQLLAPMKVTLVGWQGADLFPHTLYGIGFKPPTPGTILPATSRFVDRFQWRLDEAAARVGWARRLAYFLTCWVRSPAERQRQRNYHKVQFAVHLSAGRDPKYSKQDPCPRTRI